MTWNSWKISWRMLMSLCQLWVAGNACLSSTHSIAPLISANWKTIWWNMKLEMVSESRMCRKNSLKNFLLLLFYQILKTEWCVFEVHIIFSPHPHPHLHLHPHPPPPPAPPPLPPPPSPVPPLPPLPPPAPLGRQQWGSEVWVTAQARPGHDRLHGQIRWSEILYFIVTIFTRLNFSWPFVSFLYCVLLWPVRPYPTLHFPALLCLILPYPILLLSLLLLMHEFDVDVEVRIAFTQLNSNNAHYISTPSDPRARTLGAANCTGCDMRLAGAHRQGSGWIVTDAVTSSVRYVLRQEKEITWYCIFTMIYIYDILHEVTIWT